MVNVYSTHNGILILQQGVKSLLYLYSTEITNAFEHKLSTFDNTTIISRIESLTILFFIAWIPDFLANVQVPILNIYITECV